MIVPLRSLIVYVTIDINRSHRMLALRYKQILRCFQWKCLGKCIPRTLIKKAFIRFHILVDAWNILHMSHSEGLLDRRLKGYSCCASYIVCAARR
jgi:hypothetical protein